MNYYALFAIVFGFVGIAIGVMLWRDFEQLKKAMEEESDEIR